MKRFVFFSIITSFISIYAEPPREIPPELYNEYTMGGKIEVYEYYFNNTYTQPVIYTKEQINENLKKIAKRETFYYGPTDTFLYNALDTFARTIQGKTVGIIGSDTPLYESIILSWGGFPITIDYNPIVSEHPDLRTMTVEEYNKNPIQFDAIISISSIEHDGLGRYGDPLNPDGDLQAMQNIKHMLKKGGLLFLAVPVGIDTIYWNAHRIYGKERLPYLLNGWKIINTFGFHESQLQSHSAGWHQPLFVLTNEG